MRSALAVDISGAGSPFGAAHRLYFDTPPLKGWRLIANHTKRYRSHKKVVVKGSVVNGISENRLLPAQKEEAHAFKDSSSQ
jgi:hypothetical protein